VRSRQHKLEQPPARAFGYLRLGSVTGTWSADHARTAVAVVLALDEGFGKQKEASQHFFLKRAASADWQ
jgi:VanZ family protein